MSAKFRENKILAKWRNPPSFTDIGKSCPCREFNMLQICLLTLFAKKNLAEISGFTVVAASKERVDSQNVGKFCMFFVVC